MIKLESISIFEKKSGLITKMTEKEDNEIGGNYIIPITAELSSLHLEATSTLNLTQLPIELLDHLFTHYLSLQDGLTFGKTCRQLYDRFKISCKASRKRLVVLPKKYCYHEDRLHTFSSLSFASTKRLFNEDGRVDPVCCFYMQNLTHTSVKIILKPLFDSLLSNLTSLEIFCQTSLHKDVLQTLVETINSIKNLSSLKMYFCFGGDQELDSFKNLTDRDKSLNDQIVHFWSIFFVRLKLPVLRHLTIALLADHFSAYIETPPTSFEVPSSFLEVLRRLTSIHLYSACLLPKLFCDLLEMIKSENKQLLTESSLNVAFNLRPNDCLQYCHIIASTFNLKQSTELELFKHQTHFELPSSAITALRMNVPISPIYSESCHFPRLLRKLFSLNLGTVSLECNRYPNSTEPNNNFISVINDLSCWTLNQKNDGNKDEEEEGGSGTTFSPSNPHTLLINLVPSEDFSENWRKGLYRRRMIQCYGFSSSWRLPPPCPLSSVRTVEIVPFSTTVHADVVHYFCLDVAFPQLRRLVVVFDQKMCNNCWPPGQPEGSTPNYQECGSQLVRGLQTRLPAAVQQSMEISFEFCYVQCEGERAVRPVVRYSTLQNMLAGVKEEM